MSRYLRRFSRVTVVAPTVSEPMATQLTAAGVEWVDLGLQPMAKTSSIALFEAWVRESLRRGDRKTPIVPAGEDYTINLSTTLVTPADAWYLQGSVSDAVSDLLPNLPPAWRAGAALAGPVLRHFDAKLIATLSRLSRIHVANSAACEDAYGPWGVRVDQIIHPPVDTEVFHPMASSPSEEYCLTYFGKETDFGPLLDLADAGVELVAFGSRFRSAPRRLRSHRNVHNLGEVSDDHLARLYSNAKFAIFPFSTEPFGYVPVESMACGTPVLTYAKDGPLETVVDGQTGWLRGTPSGFHDQALRIWENGSIPGPMRQACRERALGFSADRIGAQWLSLMRDGLAPRTSS